MKKKILGSIMAIYLIISYLFYGYFWRQIVSDDSVNGAVYGEVVAASWGMEQVYQNILDGNNPFAYREGELYPFGTSLLSTDSGNGFFFVFLRPWFSINQSLSVIAVTSLVMSALGMYLLLNQLKVKTELAIVMGAVFGFSTLLHPRMGHLTYFATYVLPWFFYSYLRMREKEGWRGSLWAGLAALFGVLALYHNLTYFVILGWMIIVLVLYSLVKERELLVKEIKTQWRKLLTMGIIAIGLLSPWLSTLLEVGKFESLPSTEGWGGAIGFSADLLGIFVPSIYSRYLGGISTVIADRLTFASGIFEQHIYPGLIILLGIGLIVVRWKKLSRKNRRILSPIMSGAIFFWIMTLGPFLTVLGRWRVNLDGVPFMIPLPFAAIHYLPFMENIRSPGRLAIGMIFFATIAVALYLNQYKWKKKKYYLVIAGLVGLFLLDHPILYAPATKRILPRKIYEIIKQDDDKFSVYEMPSSVRDGFRYFGNLDSLDYIDGQLAHGKPVVAGYFGRIPIFKREYYSYNPFFGYMGRLMDKGLENNGSVDRVDLPNWQEIDIEKSHDALELLATKYLILKNNEFYTASASAVLTKLDFEKVAYEQNHTLWKKRLNNKEYNEVTVGEAGDEMYLGVGWRGRDKGFRYMGETGSIIFRLAESRTMKLSVTGLSYYKPQIAKVYVNQELVGEIDFGAEEKRYELMLPEAIPEGLVTIHLMFPHAYQPLLVEPGNHDESMISAKIMKVALEEMND